MHPCPSSREVSQKKWMQLCHGTSSRRPKTATNLVMRQIPRERKSRYRKRMRATRLCLGKSPGAKKLRQRIDVLPLLKPKIRCDRPMCALDRRLRKSKSMRVSLRTKSRGRILIGFASPPPPFHGKSRAHHGYETEARRASSKTFSTASWWKTVY